MADRPYRADPRLDLDETHRLTERSTRAVYYKCPHCDGDFRAKDILHHKARCKKNPSMYRRIRAELSN
jgi:hypothetical protein